MYSKGIQGIKAPSISVFTGYIISSRVGDLLSNAFLLRPQFFRVVNALRMNAMSLGERDEIDNGPQDPCADKIIRRTVVS